MIISRSNSANAGYIFRYNFNVLSKPVVYFHRTDDKYRRIPIAPYLWHKADAPSWRTGIVVLLKKTTKWNNVNTRLTQNFHSKSRHYYRIWGGGVGVYVRRFRCRCPDLHRWCRLLLRGRPSGPFAPEATAVFCWVRDSRLLCCAQSRDPLLLCVLRRPNHRLASVVYRCAPYTCAVVDVY